MTDLKTCVGRRATSVANNFIGLRDKYEEYERQPLCIISISAAADNQCPTLFLMLLSVF